MPLFVVGPPRSGTTVAAQALNAHPALKIFDEVSLIETLYFGEGVVGKARAFLMEQGGYEAFRALAPEIGAPAALTRVMESITAGRAVWGEKNPMYATRLDVLRGGFPDAIILFVLRDPREVVNGYLAHRASPLRTHLDFWIKDTVADALALVQQCLAPVLAEPSGLRVLRYEQFMADPKGTLDALFQDEGFVFSEDALFDRHDAPESVGNHQFFRRGGVLPWKAANLSPLGQIERRSGRIDPQDPAWPAVEALAHRLGYGDPA
jgi:hypothetical protein